MTDCEMLEMAARPAGKTLEQLQEVERLRGPREHISSPDCWCEPELDYKDPDTGAEVWVHRELQ